MVEVRQEGSKTQSAGPRRRCVYPAKKKKASISLEDKMTRGLIMFKIRLMVKGAQDYVI